MVTIEKREIAMPHRPDVVEIVTPEVNGKRERLINIMAAPEANLILFLSGDRRRKQ